MDREASERRRWGRYHVTLPVRVTIQKFLHVGAFNSLSEFKPPHFDHALTLRSIVRNHKGDLYRVEFLAKSLTDQEQLGLFRQILAGWDACA